MKAAARVLYQERMFGMPVESIVIGATPRRKGGKSRPKHVKETKWMAASSKDWLAKRLATIAVS